MADVDALRAALAHVQKDCRRQSDQERYQQRRRLENENPGHATAYVRRCCVYVYVNAKFNASVAAEYMNSCRARIGQRQFPVTQLEGVIEQWFLESHTVSPAALVDPLTPEDKRACYAAQRYCDDRELYDWVAAQNATLGLAPRTSALGDKYDEIALLRVAEGGAEAISRANMASVKNRGFFCRWRRRMGVKIRSLPPTGHLEEAEKKSKVLAPSSLRLDSLGGVVPYVICCVRLGAIFGAVFGSRIWYPGV